MNQQPKSATQAHASKGEFPRREQRKDDANAFIPDPFDMSSDPRHIDDSAGDFAEELGEEFVTSATGNVDITEQHLDQTSAADYGGPYTDSSEGEELALEDDASNPPDATREAFPSPMRGNAEHAARRS